MIPANDATAPSSPTRIRRWLLPVAAVSLLALSGCATPTGGANATPTPSVSASASPTSTPSAEPTVSAAPSPSVTAFTGDVLIVTAEVVDGQLQVTAMVPRVSEGDGVCTLEIVEDGRTATVTGAEGNDVTYCGVMSLPVQGAAEDLQFRVRYDSPSTRAESAVSTVEPTS